MYLAPGLLGGWGMINKQNFIEVFGNLNSIISGLTALFLCILVNYTTSDIHSALTESKYFEKVCLLIRFLFGKTFEVGHFLQIELRFIRNLRNTGCNQTPKQLFWVCNDTNLAAGLS